MRLGPVLERKVFFCTVALALYVYACVAQLDQPGVEVVCSDVNVCQQAAVIVDTTNFRVDENTHLLALQRIDDELGRQRGPFVQAGGISDGPEHVWLV